MTKFTEWKIQKSPSVLAARWHWIQWTQKNPKQKQLINFLKTNILPIRQLECVKVLLNNKVHWMEIQKILPISPLDGIELNNIKNSKKAHYFLKNQYFANQSIGRSKKNLKKQSSLNGKNGMKNRRELDTWTMVSQSRTLTGVSVLSACASSPLT